ncbi:AAA family ATPase [Apibacter muscae]|uniref:DNA repair ATPase n=1 Tax=Apibacter muscae TaxID=2509004 RepID=UPI0011AC7415|nr:DNA repair ATPase [Apibacter muscae]TWP24099.1 AAA family ATPase [Apibacter muscae]
MSNLEKKQSLTESLDSGTYEIIKKRLQTQQEELTSRLSQLNQARKEVFNSVEFVLESNQRINTENNCIARGIIAIENLCIFAYNVHFGLRTDIQLSDVFSIYAFDGKQFTPQSLDLINDETFINDYKNLYQYYRDSIFSRFRRTENYLYMIFQTGKNTEDLKAFKWLIKEGKLIYQDDRSIHEVPKVQQYEFKWNKTTLDNRRLGVHPHISILDKVFIEAIQGDITFKIEDNTDTGKGIYSEPVENKDQQLDDADYYYADLGNFILIRIKPYQEKFRAFVFNNRTKEVINIPKLNETGILLPDNQGIIFSNGYYLQSGEHKIFENGLENFEFVRRIPSANGEDYLYIFYQNESNTYVLMSYNLIKQAVETPIICNGFALLNTGKLIYFRSEEEAIKHHVVQIWNTPYQAEIQETPEQKDSEIYKIGNKDIVKAMAECQEIITLINKEDSYEGLYNDIAKKAGDITDSFFWISQPSTFKLSEPLKQIQEIAHTAIDEFAKVQEQKKSAVQQLEEITEKVKKLQFNIKSTQGDTLESLVKLLSENRKLQGEVIEHGNIKYIDLEKIEELKKQLSKSNTQLSDQTVEFLLREEALIPYEEKVIAEKERVNQITKVIDGQLVDENCKLISSELELLIDILNSLKIEDTTQTTKIIEKISLIFASLNEVRAQLKKKLESLKTGEAIAEFHAQLTLLDQSIVNFLELSTTPEKCDEYFTKVSVQVEEMESKFADFEEFITQIADKRDEVIKVFDAQKTRLVEQINKKTSSLEQIGSRILKNIENKASSFKTKEEIQAFFSTDLMVDKVRKLAEELKQLGDVSKAENLENSIKTSLEDSLRTLRDKTELFVDGENIISLGEYKFAVNRQPLDLTIVRRNNLLYYHLTGTGFFHSVKEEKIYQYQSIWEQDVISENNQVYRAEYLAYQAFQESFKNKNFNLSEYIKNKIEQSYAEAYLKGVHDFDAIQIYTALNELHQSLQTLVYSPSLRAVAQLFWNSLLEEEKNKLNKLIISASSVLKIFPDSDNYQYVVNNLKEQFEQWNTAFSTLEISSEQVAEYLFKEFSTSPNFTKSKQADELKKEFTAYLKSQKALSIFEEDTQDASLEFSDQFYLVKNWLESFTGLSDHFSAFEKYIDEASCLLLFEHKNAYTLVESTDETILTQLKGSHPVIEKDSYVLNYHSFIEKLILFSEESVPKFKEFSQTKEQLLEEYKKSLKVNELQPKVLTSFVRNKLINDVYFPLIGANLAKQIGVAGENKRTARMGMLLLVSPPGYGKTTLMEYLAKTLGLNFVKINGPTIGHSITSIDPNEATTSGAREELKKINLSFEMADNVMLYLDDIQHCSAEFLQKFISLADGQRKMDGIFSGESKTYDLRGKRFCVVMAGNPYTESGEKFQIPDMLANRSDVYNLGDVIGNTENLFKLSLLENSIAENNYLQKLSSRSFDDFYKLVNYIETGNEELLNLEGNYSNREIEEFISVLKKCIQVREVVMKVNQNYISSAAMDHAYRTEPAFKLQGSYRDMNKMVGKIVPLMNDEEVQELIRTHYENESQTLTSDAEANMLKLKELMNELTAEETQRWENIKTTFLKNNKLGGVTQDAQAGQVIAQLMDFNTNLEGIIKVLNNKKN